MNSFSSRWDKKEITKVQKCRICQSPDLITFIHLGPIPIPNGFLTKRELDSHEKSYPLDACYCKNCGLVQLAHITSPKVMFKNYSYIPSTAKTMVNHFEKLSNYAISLVNFNPSDLVLDIGSNDGTLLSSFKKRGARVLGVDPAKNLSKIANQSGIPTINNYFTQKIARGILKKYGPAKVICATNVVAHVHDLKDFIEGVKILLTKDGILIAEFPYLLDLLEKTEFDTIYQEHLSYFSVTSFSRLMKNHNLNLINIQKIPIHGGSLRCVVKNDRNIKNAKIEKIIQQELKSGLKDPKTYQKFAKDVETARHNLVSLLLELRSKNKRIVGYGASAKGNIVTNYCKIGPETIDYIVDSIPYKQGKYTPGMHIPIYIESRIIEDKPDYVLILAWNFQDEIMEKQKEYKRRGGKFIVMSPKLKII